ncbi:MAG: family 43 glycosylhydrolase [Lachnospiraceae bacterium]|nr:family 43 glycosylhydrolase [Lachnospiraceae bacterium]
MNFTGAGAVPGHEALRPKQAYNPYLPSWEYIPDGEPHVFGDRVYVYGSHDMFGGQVFCLGDYVCWSAPVNDLKSWRYEGVIYRRLADPLNKNGRMVLYAPDVTQGPDGRYYLYYVMDKVSVVSVAVCDTPAGEYEFLGYVHYPDGTRLGDKEGDEPQFDPGVMTEGDTTYLFTGFCGHGDKSRHGAMLTLLDKDMLTVKKAPRIVAPGSSYSAGTPFEGHAFFEAPSIRKRGGKYYFIYSSQVMHELCYAVADQADGDYQYGGVIVSNCDIGIGTYKDASLPMAYGANNHGSIEQIGEDWYIFYHRHTNDTWYCRQGCAEKIRFREDGGIDQAQITSCGLNGGPLSDIGEYSAAIACHLFNEKHTMYTGDDPAAPRICQDGADGEICGAYLDRVAKGVTCGFKSFACKGVKKIRIWTRGYLNGDFEVRTKWDGEVLGRITVESQNFWWPAVGDVQIPDGVNDLYLTYAGNGGGALKGFEFLHE